MAYSADPTLWLYTSLTAGSSHITTATSRLETILKANKIPFRALDVATDEKARMLWGRRSKGRKLPGLVKYGSVIGDLDEIEEWNEYGELKEQLNAADIGFPPAASSVDTTTTSVTPSKQEPTNTGHTPETRSRSASETRHISIAEPNDSHDGPKKEKDETPLTMAMRQAGAEAAAKAGQKKSMKAMPTATPEDKAPDVSDTTAPVVVEPKLHKASEDPEVATEITAAKTPMQLASEGAKRTSVDKIADSESPSPTSAAAETPSNEEQMLQLQRAGSITKSKSQLSSQVEPADVGESELESESAIASEDITEVEDTKTASHIDEPPMRMHRGSSISAASKEEILAVEQRNMILEEDEEDDEEDELVAKRAGGAEKTTQEQDPKSTEDAGVSIED